jgi:hypothetical protein
MLVAKNKKMANAHVSIFLELGALGFGENHANGFDSGWFWFFLHHRSVW